MKNLEKKTVKSFLQNCETKSKKRNCKELLQETRKNPNATIKKSTY